MLLTSEYGLEMDKANTYSSSCSSSVAATELPMDMITMILARLPGESLHRFKAVSKDWESLIGSPYFVNLHLNHSHPFLVAQQSQVLEYRAVDHNLTPTTKFSLVPSTFESHEICGSVNGLVTLVAHIDDESTNKYTMKTSDEVIIVNPSTNGHFVLPSAELPDSYGHRFYGFGYDEPNDDYKLVRFTYIRPEDEEDDFCGEPSSRQVMIYSSKRNCWGAPRVEDTGYLNHDESSPICALIDKHINHWIFHETGQLKAQIRGFDICSEEWRDVPSPDLAEDCEEIMHSLGVLDDCLCLVTTNDSNSGTKANVWVMKEYGAKESWVKLFSLSSDQLDVNPLSAPPIAYSEGGDKVLVRGASASDGLFWYNLRDKTMELASFLAHPVTLCVASLVPVPRKDTYAEVLRRNLCKISH